MRRSCGWSFRTWTLTKTVRACTVEPLCCGHLGDLGKCPVYSGTPLLWTPWGPGEMSRIQWNPSVVDTLGTWCSVLYTVKPLYCGHLGDLGKCPVYSGTPLLWKPWGPGEMSRIQWNPSVVDTLGTWGNVPYTVEPLCCGHLGDLGKCPVYSGTPLLWTPWGPGEMSRIQWNPSVVDTLGTWCSVLYTVKPLYCGHLGDLGKCPVYSGTPLLWTPWGPGDMSRIQWNPSVVDTLGTWGYVPYTVELLYCGDLVKCLYRRVSSLLG